MRDCEAALFSVCQGRERLLACIDTGPVLYAGITGVFVLLWIFIKDRCHPSSLSRGRKDRAVGRISLLRE